MLSQRTYPASYIWTIGGAPAPLAEYQLSLDGDVFRPEQQDAKEVRYLIAVCGDRKPEPAGLDSLMIDLSDVAFRGVPGRQRWHGTALYVDSGSGFREGEAVYQHVEYAPDFSTTFTLPPATTVRRLRWDPLELRLCTVRLHRVWWRDGAGVAHPLDLDQLRGNGERDGDGYRFETLDPMLFLPISGLVSSVTVEGECVAEGEAESLRGMEALLVRRDGELGELRRLLEERERIAGERQRQLTDLGAVCMELSASLRSLSKSRRKRLGSWLRSALHYFPKRLASQKRPDASAKRR
jgi:hypothetical protein